MSVAILSLVLLASKSGNRDAREAEAVVEPVPCVALILHGGKDIHIGERLGGDASKSSWKRRKGNALIGSRRSHIKEPFLVHERSPIECEPHILCIDIYQWQTAP